MNRVADKDAMKKGFEDILSVYSTLVHQKPFDRLTPEQQRDLLWNLHMDTTRMEREIAGVLAVPV